MTIELRKFLEIFFSLIQISHTSVIFKDNQFEENCSGLKTESLYTNIVIRIIYYILLYYAFYRY